MYIYVHSHEHVLTQREGSAAFCMLKTELYTHVYKQTYIRTYVHIWMFLLSVRVQLRFASF